MNLRCTFHVRPSAESSASKTARERLPSVIDVDVDYVDEPLPRGRTFETWTRARGWASED